MEFVTAWPRIAVEGMALLVCNILGYLHVFFQMLEDIQEILVLGY